MMATGGEGLGRVQRWMQAVITHPEGVAAGAASAPACRELDVAGNLERVITRSRSLTAGQRLAIYHRSYSLRLVGSLEAMMPALRQALGEEIFRGFAVAYLTECPSRSYTLDALDEGFVRFLTETRPDRGRPADLRDHWADFMIDLATLEHAWRRVFDGPGSEGRAVVSGEDVAAVEPEELAAFRLEPAPSLQLLRFDFPVHRYLRAVREGGEPSFPAPQETCLALDRRDYRVRISELSAADHALLAALTAGATIGEAAGGAVAPGQLAAWAEQGFFATLCSPIPQPSEN